MKTKQQTILLTAILLTGLVLRFLAADSYWKWYDTTFPGSWRISKLVLSHDGQQYIHQARPDTWRSSHTYYQQWENRPYYRPPLASYYFKYLFQASSFDRLAVSTVQSLLAAGAYLFLYLLTAQMFSRRVAVVSLLVLMIHPVLIFYDTSFEDSPLALFLLSATLYTIVRPWGRERRRWILSGILMGLTLLVRPNLVIVFFCLALYSWLLNRKGRVVSILQFSLPVLILLSFPIWHNYRISGRLSFVTDTSGENLFWGNNAHPEYRITTQGFWRIPFVDQGNPAKLLFDTAREESGERSLDRALRAAVLGYVRENPLQAGYGLLKKALRHMSNYEFPRNRNFSWLRTSSPPFRLPLIPYSVLAALALLGWVLVFPRTRPMFILLAPWICAFLVEVIFFNASRYRAMGIPFLVPLAVVGALSLHGELVRRKWSRGLAAGLLLVLFFLAGQFSVAPEEKRAYVSASYYKAAMLESYAEPDGRFRLISENRFTRNLLKALEYTPDNLDAYSMYTKYLIISGRSREVARNLRERRERCHEGDILCREVCASLEKFLKRFNDGQNSSLPLSPAHLSLQKKAFLDHSPPRVGAELPLTEYSSG